MNYFSISSKRRNYFWTRKKWVEICAGIIVVSYFARGILFPRTTIHSPISEYKSPFQVPFCDPKDGMCREEPDQPSPRTIYSARSKDQYDDWWKSHAKLNRSAEEYDAAMARTATSISSMDSRSASRPIILLGDSITESWIGTGMGKYKSRADGVPEVLYKMTKENFLNITFDPLVLAISGDQTQHLLYRLQNGHIIPEYSYVNDENSVFVLMIGTNNLGSGMLPGQTARGIFTVAEYVLRNTKGNLIILDLLPRGDGKDLLPSLCPPRCTSSGKSFRSFMPAISKVNFAIEGNITSTLKNKYGEKRVGALACGSNFLLKNAGDGHSSYGYEEDEVDVALMPDLLHPNADGHEILAQCILDYINRTLLTSN